MKNKYLQNYVNHGFKNIEGWCSLLTLEVLDHLTDIGINKAGGSLEIGIHHGKLFLALNSIIDSTEKSYAVDIFDKQNLNVDRSGQGNLAIFQEHLKKYDRHQGKNVNILTEDSTTLSPSDFDSKFRFISVDGGHTSQHLISDLSLAEKVMMPEGVVIVDDWFNIGWPQVTEGLMVYMNNKGPLIPFAVSPNKMWMAKVSHYWSYVVHCANMPNKRKADLKICGNTVIMIDN